MEQSTRRPLHPLVTIAAVAVIVFCTVGIAAIAGWIPTSRSTPALEAETDSGPTEPEAPAPARKSTSSVQPPASVRPVQRAAPSEVPAAQPRSVQAAAEPAMRTAPAICIDCGTVVSVREVKQSGEGSGLGAIAGGVAGGVLGNQVGGGRGRDIATVVGAVGGAVAGHQVEKHVKSSVVYQIAVEMEDGSNRTFSQPQPPTWRPGDKVRIEGDRLVARG